MGRGVVLCVLYWDLLNAYFSQVVYKNTLKYDGQMPKLVER